MASLGLLLLISFCMDFSSAAAAAQFTCLGDEPAAQQCSAAALSISDDDDSVYAQVLQPTLAPSHLQDLPGFTRSVYERDHALIAPESRVFSALPGWTNTQGAYLITPAMGSHFTMYLANMEGSSASGLPPSGVERLVFVVTGAAFLSTHLHHNIKVPVDGYAYLPPHVNHSIVSSVAATLLVIERRYVPLFENLQPELLIGNVKARPLLETPGEVFLLRKLLPADPLYDFNIHIMDFEPGEYLNVKEVHYNQHGLLLLEGRGIYRLGNKWYPVQAGDVIWMAPFIPQWYAALGQTKSRYLLYKDVNREPGQNY